MQKLSKASWLVNTSMDCEAGRVYIYCDKTCEMDNLSEERTIDLGLGGAQPIQDGKL